MKRITNFRLVVLSAIVYCSQSIADMESLELGGLETDDIFSVITPARLKQSVRDSPNSVTVITSDMIRNLGIDSVLEALRLVPGFLIDYRHSAATHASASYHGTNALSAKRMNVMINGRPIYRPALSQTLWETLPVDIDEVSRIEVVRGPASATYGANSFLGVINIITKGSVEHLNAVSGRVDSRGGHIATANYGHNTEHTRLAVIASNVKEIGPDSTDQHDSDFRGNLERTYLKLGIGHDWNKYTSIEVDYRHTDTDREVDFIDGIQLEDPDINYKDHYLGTKFDYTRGNFYSAINYSYMNSSSRQDWHSCRPAVTLLEETYDLFALNPVLFNELASGQPPTISSEQELAAVNNLLGRMAGLGIDTTDNLCATLDNHYDESTSLIELEGRYSTPDLRISGVYSFRKDKAESETYFDGERAQDIQSISINAMWLPVEKVTLNLGGNYEKSEFFTGLFSPRAALGYHLNSSNTIRYTYSRAYRTPDMWEQTVDWKYRVYDVSTSDFGIDDPVFYLRALSPGNLDAEKIVSHEVAYHGVHFDQSLILDIKAFKNELSQLLSQELELLSFDPRNDGEVALEGAEIEARYLPSQSSHIYLGLAYLDSETERDIERTLYSKYSGYIGVSRTFSDKLTLSSMVSFATNDSERDLERGFMRLDFTGLYRPEFNADLELSLNARYWPNSKTSVIYSTDNVFTANTLGYDEKYMIAIKAKYFY